MPVNMIAGALAFCVSHSPLPPGSVVYDPGQAVGHKWEFISLEKFHGTAAIAVPCMDQEGPYAPHVLRIYLKEKHITCAVPSQKAIWDYKDGGWRVRIRCPVGVTISN